MKTKVRRRGFIRLAGMSSVLGVLGGVFGVAGKSGAQPAAGSPAQRGIELNTIKRRGIGLRSYDPDRASPGFTLFAPFANTNTMVRGMLFIPGICPTRPATAISHGDRRRRNLCPVEYAVLRPAGLPGDHRGRRTGPEDGQAPA